MLSTSEVYNFLRKQKRSSSGPDDLPHWFWKTYANELAPAITKIFNVSLKLGLVPAVWKRANVVIIPKEPVINSCSQLRPISLTDIIMMLFERCVYKTEIAAIMKDSVDSDQYAYKQGHNSTIALIKCQHMLLKHLDNGAKYVRVLPFDLSKAFDNVPHDVLLEKVKKLPLNPYVVNRLINFLQDREQRVTVDSITTNFLRINRGVRQGTVLGPILFSIMVNDIKAIDLKNELWAENNRMALNVDKTYEMIVRGKGLTTVPCCIPSIKRKTFIKLLAVTLKEIPTRWDRHFEEMLSKASERMYILRVCKYYAFNAKQRCWIFSFTV